MDLTKWVTKGRRVLRCKTLKRTDTESVGDDQTSSTVARGVNEPLPKLPATDQAPDEIFIPNGSEILPKSSVAASESEILTDLPTKDSKKPEEAILHRNEVDKLPSPTSSTPNKLDSAESSPQETENLWDVAYDNLRPQHADLLEKYERILTLWQRAYTLQRNRRFSHNRQRYLFQHSPHNKQERNLFQHSHHQERRQYAQDIIAFCLEAQQESNVSTDIVKESNKNSNSQTALLKFSKQTRDVLKPSIDNVEDAAFAWAGTCLALQVSDIHSFVRCCYGSDC